MTIEYEITVTGCSHKLTQECPDDGAFTQVAAFCKALADEGFHYENSWWSPGEIARVDWRVLDA